MSNRGHLEASNPRLSVVVPIFNVERYLAECFDSILAQRFSDLEVIAVDDGSTDASAAIAADYVGRCEGWRLIRTGNRGLAAARNTGIQYCRGEYLTFVDSDDIVLPRAYQSMVSTLDNSGSAFAVASAVRNFPSGPGQPAWMRRLHATRRIGTTVTEAPGMLLDVFAWNKVIRKSFWDLEGLSFPEGLLYEDQVAFTRAYLTAHAFDVLVRPSVFWRIRGDGTSITQNRASMVDLRDRIVTKRMTAELIEQLGSPEVRRHWWTHIAPSDLPLYLCALPGCEQEYWQVLQEGVRTLWQDAPSLSESTLGAPQRLVAWLVYQGRRTDAEQAWAFFEENREELPVETRDGHRVALLPFVDQQESGIPPELYRLRDREVDKLDRQRGQVSV